jgi:hypothetical protein
MAKAKDPIPPARPFIKVPRELGTNDDPERFKEIVRKVARAVSAKQSTILGEAR